MGTAPPVDAIEKQHRRWHGQQTKKGIKKAKARKRSVKRAQAKLRTTTKPAIVKALFKTTDRF